MAYLCGAISRHRLTCREASLVAAYVVNFVPEEWGWIFWFIIPIFRDSLCNIVGEDAEEEEENY